MRVGNIDKIHVLINVPFLEEIHLAKIASVDPRVVVTNAMEEIRAELGITTSSVFPVRHLKGLEFTPKEASIALDRMLAHTEVIFGWRLPLNLLSRAPHLRWVQGIGTGIDLLAGNTGILDSEVMVTNAGGFNSTAVAEYALCLVLMLAKKAPRLFANKGVHRWERLIASELDGKTLGVVGLGKIGSKVASLARAFGMRVVATKRSVTRREKDVTGVDELFPSAQLLQMLKECDFVILAVPLTSETRGIIGEAELRGMKPTAYIINIARGPVIKQDVLLRALKEGWIAGAGLDVFENEPLPPENELWELPNVIISPHFAGIREHEAPALTELFCDNLRRFLNGDALINLIDKEKGY